MKDKVIKILEDIRADIDFVNLNQKLIDDDLLDSFDIISIIGEFNEAFDVEISVDKLLPENFNTPDAMVELIMKLQQE
ncbi:MAG: phosphopantetheine-binding protein [Lachnospiraceae bacterium]|nr:phosphopantetheine-binding protein [Lachnospiraceae bacterium]